MNKLILLLFLTFFSIPENKKQLYNECLKPVVLIKSTISSSSGTGFIVRSQKSINKLYINTVITCAHVCDEKFIIKVPVYERWSVIKYREYNTVVISKNKSLDLSVVVFFSEEPMLVADLDLENNHDLDDDVFIIGCGLGENPRLSKGVITGFSTLSDLYRTSVSCVPGDSGSPLYRNNKVIAVCLGIKNYNHQILPDISVFCSIKEIKNLLEKNKFFLINKNDTSVPRLFYFSLLERVSR